ncbi:HGL010Wp [Eremothecium sinecaudum]|uniref:ATP-dependent DNA helicase CHL1 n=1 Tax=Eremothecium sinecaudum TaxID=45286 RepID=A0A0X8HVN7_9SACH|nr:HGL010Wp [Eremothecium sinecaudum]AMD22330.1 HGL010Wp [Eremothecium sinecaudum]
MNDFHHPFKPYEIQLQLMQKIYDLLAENKKLGIFESPTGTGKTLSLICSAVTWLREHKSLFVDTETKHHGDDTDPTDDNDDDDPEWVKESYEKSMLMAKSVPFKQYEDYLDSLPRLHSSHVADVPVRAKRRRIEVQVEKDQKDEEFLPNEYDSDGDSILDCKNDTRNKLNVEIATLLKKLDQKDHEDLPMRFRNPIKIYFASRTHSQLSQFISELRLPTFPPSFNDMKYERVKVLPFASRKQMCINEKVSRVRSDLINDACIDSISKSECIYYSNSREETSSRKVRDYTFNEIHDIEELVKIGKEFQTCPYYSSRESVHVAEIVTLPYQHLLLKNARTTLGIDLKDSIIIIDEAHNLIDTINSIYSASISLLELKQCRCALQAYLRRFRARLNSVNRVNILKLVKMINVLIDFIETNYKQGKQLESPQEIFQGSNADIINIYRLERYMKVSKIAFKIDSYIQNMAVEPTDTASSKDEVNAYNEGFNSKLGQPILFKVAAFLNVLANPSKEGQFFFEKGQVLKYMLLEPSEIFKDLIKEAKSVLLVGGTMEPVSDIIETLVPYLPESDIVKFCCDHVIPDENLSAYIVGDTFQFTYDKRQDKQLVLDLFDFLYKLSCKAPAGMVVFFSSYSHLEFVLSTWKNLKLFEKLNRVKKIFHESSSGADVLQNYADTILNEKLGAVLCAVVNGKLSEGINFKDDLARSVVMVGLPFPNLFSGELIVKQRHLAAKIIGKGGSSKEASIATREFYENICMRAVNQSVGRAIRHAGDYATIYFIDNRYQSPSIKAKLSQWVRKRIQPKLPTSIILVETERFFKRRQL